MESEIRTRQGDEFLSIVFSVRTLGGVCPAWAERLPRSTDAPHVEIVVVRAAPRDFGGWDDATARIVIVNSDLAPERFHGEGVFWLLSAAAADLDVIAEGCFRMACPGGMWDRTDEIDVAGGRNNALPLGRASVVPGMLGDSVLRAARPALRAMVEDGFDGGIVLMQGVTTADESRWTLQEMDEVASAVVDGFDAHRILFYFYLDAVMASAWTIIAFRKSDGPATSEHSDDR